MAYFELEDLKKVVPESELVQITDDAGTGEIDEGVVNAARSRAEALIDTYCSQRYAVPFDPVPGVVKELAIDIALWQLYNRVEGAGENEYRRSVEERYRAAIQMLERIADGSLSIGTPQTKQSATMKVSTKEKDIDDSLIDQYRDTWE